MRSISFINNAHMERHCKIQTGNDFVPREMDLLHKRGEGGQTDKAIRYRDVSSLVPPCLYFTLYNNDGIFRVLLSVVLACSECGCSQEEIKT